MTRRTPGWGLDRYLHQDDVTVWLRDVMRRLVQDSASTPLYGSPEWHEADDPTRLASALRAAEAYRRESLFAADDLVDRQAIDARIDAAEWAELGAQVRKMADTPTHDELAARRRQVPAGTGQYAGRQRRSGGAA